ncbi:MAG: lipid IV(A) 3-deoxy-D-manno-octulosonic acid transferase [Campylobacterota bacterium]|nr:lipid IV(A) 3-deoxy-D-manno-octulosonic acid transferase [Campylobacterota bacterium]
MKLFTLVYYLLALLLYIVALPLLILLAFKSKYRESIPSRFFLKSNPKFKKNGIWFHVCSLGEARALAPLMDELKDLHVNISTITHTGFKEAQKYQAQVRYLPFEIFLPFWIQKPKVLFVLEAEFWYLLFAVVKARGSRLVLLNARISERSFPKYLRFGWFYRKLLSYCDHIYVQSEADKNRFIALGALHVRVLGNIKLAQKIATHRVFIKPEDEIITAGSTHEGEESFILSAFIEYKKSNASRLIIVPRHPERFERVWQDIVITCKEHNLTCNRFSEGEHFDADIILVDAMGELNNIYAISDIVILGGAFKEDVGGHNPLEPSHFGCKIITGEHIFNQRELFKYVHHVQFVTPQKIGEALQVAKNMPPSQVDEKIDLEAIIKEIKSYS